MILARFVDFDVTQTNALPWQLDVRLLKKSLNCGNYLPFFYMFYHFLSKYWS